MHAEDPREAVLDFDVAVISKLLGILTMSADDAMYSDVLDLVRAVFGSRFGFFGYIDEESALVCPSMTREVFDVCQVENKSIVFPRASWGGLWGRILVEKEALYKNQSHGVPAGHLPLHRSLGAPILYRDELVGSIHVANREADYTDRDLHLMEMIASIIAPVLSARLERDRQDTKRRAAEASMKLQAKELARANVELARVNEELILQFRKHLLEIQELSTPVIQIWRGVLVAPLVGGLDLPRMNQLMVRLLDDVVRTGAAVVLIDITGLPTVDTRTAQHLFAATATVRLLGAQVVLTGVRPPIAQTMVSLGLDFSTLTTRSTLASGLEYAFKALRLRVISG
jgi:anti-anti-sigma regulatory factor